MVDPRTRESRGFGFVSMSSVEEADRCIKYLDRSVFEGRVITVEKVIVAYVCLLIFWWTTTRFKNTSGFCAELRIV